MLSFLKLFLVGPKPDLSYMTCDGHLVVRVEIPDPWRSTPENVKVIFIRNAKTPSQQMITPQVDTSTEDCSIATVREPSTRSELHVDKTPERNVLLYAPKLRGHPAASRTQSNGIPPPVEPELEQPRKIVVMSMNGDVLKRFINENDQTNADNSTHKPASASINDSSTSYSSMDESDAPQPAVSEVRHPQVSSTEYNTTSGSELAVSSMEVEEPEPKQPAQQEEDVQMEDVDNGEAEPVIPAGPPDLTTRIPLSSSSSSSSGSESPESERINSEVRAREETVIGASTSIASASLEGSSDEFDVSDEDGPAPYVSSLAERTAASAEGAIPEEQELGNSKAAQRNTPPQEELASEVEDYASAPETFDTQESVVEQEDELPEPAAVARMPLETPSLPKAVEQSGANKKKDQSDSSSSAASSSGSSESESSDEESDGESDGGERTDPKTIITVDLTQEDPSSEADTDDGEDSDSSDSSSSSSSRSDSGSDTSDDNEEDGNEKEAPTPTPFAVRKNSLISSGSSSDSSDSDSDSSTGSESNSDSESGSDTADGDD